MTKRISLILVVFGALAAAGCGGEKQTFSPPKQPEAASRSSNAEQELTPLGQQIATQDQDARGADAVIPAPIALDVLGTQLMNWAPQGVEPSSVGSGLPIAAAAWRNAEGTTITLFVSSVDATSAAQILAGYGVQTEQHANALVTGTLGMGPTKMLDTLATGGEWPPAQQVKKPATAKTRPSQIQE